VQESDLDQLISLGEGRSVEFKTGGNVSDNHFLARTTRAILAMANTRGGGRVLVGVDETPASLKPTGISAADVTSWKYDDLTAKVAAHADPYVSFTLEIVVLSGLSIAVIQVDEFEEIPVICKKAFVTPAPQNRVVLRQGATYVRGRPKPESIEVANQADMRELIDLATEKQLNKFIRQARAAGMISASSPGDIATATGFQKEREAFFR